MRTIPFQSLVLFAVIPNSMSFTEVCQGKKNFTKNLHLNKEDFTKIVYSGNQMRILNEKE